MKKYLFFICLIIFFVSCNSEKKEVNDIDLNDHENGDTALNDEHDEEIDADLNDESFDEDNAVDPDVVENNDGDTEIDEDGEETENDGDDDEDVIDDGRCIQINIGNKYDFGTITHGNTASSHISVCNTCGFAVIPDALKDNGFFGKCGSISITDLEIDGNPVDTSSGFDILLAMSLQAGLCAEMDAVYDSGYGEYYPEILHCELKGSFSDGFDYSILFTGTSGENSEIDQDECPALKDLCYIDGKCYSNGAHDPVNLCRICDPASSGTWSYKNENNICDDGLINTTGDKCNDSGVCSGTVDPEGVPPMAGIDAGWNYTCALGENGKAYCWGMNNSGQAGPGSSEFKILSPFEITVSGGFSKLSAGYSHVCALSNGEEVFCWGSNLQGQLGKESSDPVPLEAVSGISGVESVSAGGYHSCALLDDGTVKCWGNNEHGTLGNGTTEDSASPVSVNGLQNVKAISAGFDHVCAVINDGTVKCWGSNEYSQLGSAGVSFSSTPVEIGGISSAADISCGRYHSCILLLNGKVECWGESDYELLGNYFTWISEYSVESMITGASTTIDAGDSHSCAVLDDNSSVCWGYNEYGQLGTGYTSGGSFVKYPVDVRNVSNGIKDIACGTSHTCAVFTDGSVRCWGSGSYGELGSGNESSSLIPAEISWND